MGSPCHLFYPLFTRSEHEPAEKKDSISQIDQEGIISDLESYLVRRMICGLTSKNYNRTFIGLLRYLRQLNTITREEVQKYLIDLYGDSARWPSDQEFQQCWMAIRAYEELRPEKVKMILTALDLQLETSKQEQVHLSGGITVEHVMPQYTIPQHWPLPASDDEDEKERQQLSLRRWSLIHTFGNLTLLTGNLNSSISNGPFSAKRSEITKHSRIRLNTYFQDFTDEDQWSEDSIVERSEWLFQIALKIWPRPNNSS